MGRSVARRVAALALLAAALVAPGSTPAGAATARFVSGWVPYWNSADGRASFNTMPTMFEDISPFFATTNIDGSIGMFNTTAFRQTITDARAQGLTVLPSITDGTGNQMATLLGTPGWQDQHVAAVVNWVDQYATDGADLDYEGFAFTDNNGVDRDTVRQRWVAFVQALSSALHAQGKLLSITIPPEWGTSSGYPQYAQGQLAPSVDRIRLMAYDWSVSSPGPIAPLTWDDQVIAKSSSLVADRTKLVLGIPAYGRNWAQQVNSGELCPTGSLSTKSVTTDAAAGLAAAHGVTPVRDSSGEMRFGWTETVTGILISPVTPPPYTPTPPAKVPMNGGVDGDFQPAQRLGTSNQTVTCTIRHTVYYPDAWVSAQRAAKAKANGWRGVVVWALGFEDQATRDALFSVATN